ncbi:MAG: PilZ domain-containing protein [Syntrophales bacterium]
MDQDKRKRSRAPVGFDGEIVARGERIPVRIINISLTGILCTTDRRLLTGDDCGVVIALGEDLHITVEGKVLRVGTEETAIAFSAMDEESFAHLNKVVQYNTGDADRIEREFRQKAFNRVEKRTP